MAKLYGWGASVVIIGALFKINHYWGADIMLIVGLGTESVIFFFSAFEPPHVEPDWSLVYPQLAGIYHGESVDVASLTEGESVTKELDKMLEEAKIGPELIENLGQGLRNLSETTSKLSDVSNAALANDQYINTMKSATESASVLNESYKKTSKAMDHNVAVSEEHLQHLQSISKNASVLSDAYFQASNSIKDEISLNKEFNSSIANATTSAKKFVEKYNESAELLSKTSETLSSSALEGNNYNKNLQNVSKNLAALNALYELHLQSSNHQMESTNKVNEAMNKLVHNLQDSVVNTARYKDSVEILNKVFEQQIEGSEKQAEATIKMHETINDFLSNLHDSVEKTAKFKEEVDALAKNISALNRVYGNMLSAMNVNLK
ncbi:MAG TPA: gliding motility protein GldL [Bacteroidales bacterium]|nr:gliding motility protein GldL [Bacteroidales bacterium]